MGKSTCCKTLRCHQCVLLLISICAAGSTAVAIFLASVLMTMAVVPSAVTISIVGRTICAIAITSIAVMVGVMRGLEVFKVGIFVVGIVRFGRRNTEAYDERY